MIKLSRSKDSNIWEVSTEGKRVNIWGDTSNVGSNFLFLFFRVAAMNSYIFLSGSKESMFSMLPH